MIIKLERFSTGSMAYPAGSKSQEPTTSSRMVEDAPPSYEDILADPVSSSSSNFQFTRPQPPPQQAPPTNQPEPALRPPPTLFSNAPNGGTLPERHSSYVPQTSFPSRPSPRPFNSVISPNSAPAVTTSQHRKSFHSPHSRGSSVPHLEKPPLHPSSRQAQSRDSDGHRPAKKPHVAPVYVPKKQGWLGGGKEKQMKEAREWVIGHINDLVRQTHTYDLDACNSILGACTEACAITSSLYLSDILQERFIDGHTPFYWSIIHRPAKARLIPDLLAALLKFGAPINHSTREDIRHACLTLHDQQLFQQLRSSRKFMPRRRPEIMENGKMPIDEIRVQEIPGAEAVFRVDFEIPSFLKRMHFEREVSLEFIAHRRAWHLYFKSSPTKSAAEASWDLTLSLSEFSSPTYIDSQFTVLEASLFPPKPPSSLSQPSSSSKPSGRYQHPKPSPSMPNLLHNSSSGPRNPTRNDKENSSPSGSGSGSGSRLRSPPRSGSGGSSGSSPTSKALSSPGPMMVRLKSSSMIVPGKKDVTVSLGAGSPIGTAVRLRSSDYLSPEGTLRAKLEARLTKPEPDSSCIIC